MGSYIEGELNEKQCDSQADFDYQNLYFMILFERGYSFEFGFD